MIDKSLTFGRLSVLGIDSKTFRSFDVNFVKLNPPFLHNALISGMKFVAGLTEGNGFRRSST